MDKISINEILKREEIETKIKNILYDFEVNKNNLLYKKGIYIYGDPGTGKTTFITNILKQLDYDVIKYDAGDVRNTTIIEEITKHNMSDKNIMSLFNKKSQKIAVIMDEIDGMNNGDKGGINSLIKLIRPKKTKKQKLEEVTMNPIICIGNYKVDKKIKELIKVCNSIELQTPTLLQITTILNELLPELNNEFKDHLITYIGGDLRKMNNIYKLYISNPAVFTTEVIQNLLQIKSFNDDTKNITNKLFNNYYNINKHNIIINETDRTSIGLLWHENIVDHIENFDKKISLPFYIKQLENICFADYIDRITFQKQIWQFNEMSSLIKTCKNNKHYHEFCQTNVKKGKTNSVSGTNMTNMTNNNEIRFTKVLTKYSTEYNNSLFIQKLCQKLGMDKKDLFIYFIHIKHHNNENELINLMENYDITKLDINRIYRYIEKYLKENAAGIIEKDVEEEEFFEEELIDDFL
jgi:DNA polymerase III delta prime subunit